MDLDLANCGACRGEQLPIVEGAMSREVIGRMDNDDVRANAALVRPVSPGIHFRDEHGPPDWKPCQRIAFWRREDGTLQYTR